MTRTAKATDVSLYRAVWRWHFYAGLIILPVLVWLATTGALYLYKPELERALYREWVVIPSEVVPSSIADQIEAVERQTHARVTQVTRPATASESWRFVVQRPDGDEALAFVRPDTGLVLGVSRAGGPMDLVKKLHSLSIAGPVANVLVEIVAGWAIVLVLTGLYLWWPRAGNRALSLAGRVGERRFWRNFHASTGALVGAVILFLAVTGMPWTTFWGSRFHAFVAAQGIGRPPAPQAGGHEHDEHLPWSLRGSTAPMAMGAGDVGPDAAIQTAARQGLVAPWVLDLPTEPGEPYRVARLISHAQDARLLYVEPSSGRVLGDVRWSQIGAGAKVFEWGIYTHQGQEYGEANRLVMLAGCVGVWLLAISAPILWWKRRRGGGLNAPPAPTNPAQTRAVAAIMLMVGTIYPLTGVSMVAALAGDWATGHWRRRR